jgi:hypothetical protein
MNEYILKINKFGVVFLLVESLIFVFILFNKNDFGIRFFFEIIMNIISIFYFLICITPIFISFIFLKIKICRFVFAASIGIIFVMISELLVIGFCLPKLSLN